MNIFKENTHYQIHEKEGENLPGTVFTEEFDKVASILFLKKLPVPDGLASQYLHLFSKCL